MNTPSLLYTKQKETARLYKKQIIVRKKQAVNGIQPEFQPSA